MKEVSELLFFLTAYPWFFISTCLLLILVFLGSRAGLKARLVSQRFFSDLLHFIPLREYRERDKSGHESQTLKVQRWCEGNSVYYRITPCSSLTQEDPVFSGENPTGDRFRTHLGRGLSFPHESALNLDEVPTSLKHRR